MHDVIVVGARCAGSSLAMLLARQGLKVLLVEFAPFPREVFALRVAVRDKPGKRLGS